MVGRTLGGSLKGRVNVWELLSYGREEKISGSMMGLTVKNLTSFLDSTPWLEEKVYWA